VNIKRRKAIDSDITELKNAEKEIKQKTKEITDSITYAKRIQRAILPHRNDIWSALPQSFVLFKPKDIVSGDFYWFHHKDELSYIAVVDCTGHGVPGALMSMIAHSLLNEIVLEKKITDPAEVLSRLHHLVFRTLQQEKGDEYSQDGMDISLVIIDHKNKLLKFSGARNNAFLTDGKTVSVLKATAKSIGGVSVTCAIEPQRQFKSETVELNDTTMLVMSTDGISDQLNKEDLKFGSSRFKEMVLTLSNHPVSEGASIVSSTVNEWKTTVTQLDDMLLMAIALK
jgi:serine phosphatase RsbU (regulator of sigma subunit)